MTNPVFIHEVDESLRDQFNDLMEAMEDIVVVNPIGKKEHTRL